MSTSQWLLNLALLGWVLTRNLGTRAVTRTTFAVPVAVVAVAAAVYLRHLPTAGHDLGLEVAGAGTGVVLGLVAAALTTVSAPAGRVVVRAGAGFAALWLVVVGGRVAFAEWATHSGARAVGEFSLRHQVTGADAWTAAFVLMAVAMVAVRALATGIVVARRVRRTPAAGPAARAGARAILVVAPDRRVRTALASLLQSDPRVRVVCLEASLERATGRLLSGDADPDVLVLDLGRTSQDGLRLIAAALPTVPVVALGFDDDQSAAALAAGAACYLPATAGPDRLLAAVHRAARGRRRAPVGSDRRWLLGFALAAFLGPWLVWGSRIAQEHGLLGWHLPQGVALWSITPALLLFVGVHGGRAGLRELAGRLTRWQVPPRTFAVALAAPPALAGAAVLAVRAAGHRVAVGVDLSLPAALVLLTFGTFLYLLTEEAAWRGLLLPRLQRRLRPGPAGLVVGLVWAVWHLPLLSVPGEHDQGLPVLGFAVLVVATSVLVTALVNAARGSVLVAAVFHASFNASYGYLGVVGADRAVFWTTTALSVAAAAVVLRRRPASAQRAGATGSPAVREEMPGARSASPVPPGSPAGLVQPVEAAR